MPRSKACSIKHESDWRAAPVCFVVRVTPSAHEDLQRLYECLLDLAKTVEDLDQADLVRAAVMASLRLLERSPFGYRKAEESAFLRELIVPFGGTG